MNSIKIAKFLGIALITGFLFTLCTSCDNNTKKPITEEKPKSDSKKANDPSVTVWILSDPDHMNPLTSTSAHSRYIQNAIYSRLLEYDPKTLQLVPQTAVGMPEVKSVTEGEYKGGMSLTFEIRKEAVWDDGKPVTGYDFLFTIKAIKNPLVNAGPLRPYYEFMDEVVVDESNNKKFTIYSKEPYFLATEAAGDMHILPEHIYDAEGLMKKFSVKQLNGSFSELSNNADVKRFAEQFNDTKYDRQIIVGSGPYTFKEWTNGQHIILELKKDWWGNKVSDVAMLKAYPNKLTYKVVNEENTAITLAQDEGLDVLSGIKPPKFIELKEDEKFQKNFELSTPDQISYYYLGINTKNPKFTDKRVRKALAYLINRDDIIESLFSGLAIKTNSPINPNKPYYNNKLKDIPFDVEAAKRLLTEAGWVDADKNGVVEKMINGKKVEMVIKFKYNHGNETRKNIGVLFQEAAKNAGIRVELEAREWAVFLDETKRRDYDVMCSAWIHGPGLDDLKQIWHTTSDTRDGSNRSGFGTPESDKLIDEIRMTLDDNKRKELYMRVQEIIFEEQPYVFICVPSERLVIHNRFKNTETSALRPGYREVSFQLKSSEKAN